MDMCIIEFSIVFSSVKMSFSDSDPSDEPEVIVQPEPEKITMHLGGKYLWRYTTDPEDQWHIVPDSKRKKVLSGELRFRRWSYEDEKKEETRHTMCKMVKKDGGYMFEEDPDHKVYSKCPHPIHDIYCVKYGYKGSYHDGVKSSLGDGVYCGVCDKKIGGMSYGN